MSISTVTDQDVKRAAELDVDAHIAKEARGLALYELLFTASNAIEPATIQVADDGRVYLFTQSMENPKMQVHPKLITEKV